MSAADWARAYVAGRPVVGRAAADVLLAPAEWAYRVAIASRARLYARGMLDATTPPIPVVSVGNLLVGGAGKTPVAAYVADRLRGLGASPVVLHGGYADDEPALHRLWNPEIPVIVGRDRSAGVRAAAARGADVAVLDDGFQHMALRRALDLVLVPVDRWEASPRLLPRGPWREAPSAIARADVILLTHRGAPADGAARVRAELAPLTAAPVAEIVLEAVGWRRLGPGPGDQRPEGPVLGVCAIAHPEGFRHSAIAAGADLAELRTYGDHHHYDDADVEALRRLAGGRPIVTTEKDGVKLGALAARTPVWALRERVSVVAGEVALRDALTGVCP
ncbi:MAG TPA: tetraacyldisaccharide 4'-kinase [Longimicrobiales bacterium]|nr:tetraacyldisaccharide 4'-kinase [Longimicrobiales bacterium]